MSDTGRVEVRFEPSGMTALVEPGITLIEAARIAGVAIPVSCGGRATCGSCAVRVLAGALAEPDEVEFAALGRTLGNLRFACRARIAEGQPVTVRPLASSAATVQSAELETGSGVSASQVSGSDVSGTVPVELVAAIDVGTTTVAAIVAEADGGRVLGSATVPNHQQSWGADVLARVSAAIAGEAAELRQAVMRSVNEALTLAAGGEGRSFERVAVAGNPAMSGLFTGVPVATLAQHPFSVPSYPQVSGEQVLGSHRVRQVLVFPAIAGFVGGDALAGLVHIGALRNTADTSAPELLVDLGTNAEIALFAGGSLWAASAAAGPAFEAAGIECGLPAVPGAIVRVSLAEGDPTGLRIETLDDIPPAGIAGSGLISIAALLRSTDHLAASGLLTAVGPLESRFFRGEDGILRLALDDAGRVTVSQADLRALQLAKGAVAVGVRSVLETSEFGAEDLAAVHVAGAFGSGLHVHDLTVLGVLPERVEAVVRSAGNAALAGALDIALKPDLLRDAETLAKGATHVDLAAMPGFNKALMAALEFAPVHF